VTNVIYELRSVLTAGQGEAQWIQSVARRGYRFTAPIRVADALPDPPARRADGVGRGGEPTDALVVGREREIAL